MKKNVLLSDAYVSPRVSVYAFRCGGALVCASPFRTYDDDDDDDPADGPGLVKSDRGGFWTEEFD